MDPQQSTEVASWVQTGGLLAFASAVYWEIRQIRPWMKAIFESLAILKDRAASDQSPPGKRRKTNPALRVIEDMEERGE